MKSNFKITLDLLQGFDYYGEVQEVFKEAFPNGGEYQEILDRFAEEEKIYFCKWFLNAFGSTNDVRVYEEDINTPEKNIVFAGYIEFRKTVTAKNIIAGRSINAGRDINAGEYINAGWSIKAGRNINAGWNINAGSDYGIYAGLRVRISKWKEFAIVTAKEKPDNLISGYWKEKE